MGSYDNYKCQNLLIKVSDTNLGKCPPPLVLNKGLFDWSYEADFIRSTRRLKTFQLPFGLIAGKNNAFILGFAVDKVLPANIKGGVLPPFRVHCVVRAKIMAVTTGRHPLGFGQSSVINNKCVYIRLYIIANLVFKKLQLL